MTLAAILEKHPSRCVIRSVFKAFRSSSADTRRTIKLHNDAWLSSDWEILYPDKDRERTKKTTERRLYARWVHFVEQNRIPLDLPEDVFWRWYDENVLR